MSPATMIGLDFPVKPEWIHTVHQLWQPDQLIGELVQAALTQTMQELGGEKTRRNSLSIILRNFVKTEGGSQSRHTVKQDIWAIYSKAYSLTDMSPAYLVQIISHNPVAQEAAIWIHRRFAHESSFTSNEFRRQLIARYGERKVVLNTGSAFLATLCYFGALNPGEVKNTYFFRKRLPVSREIYPLIPWTIWRASQVPQIDLDSMEANPALAFLDTSKFLDFWKVYHPDLWALSERIDIRQATLKMTTENEWEDKLIKLLERTRSQGFRS